MFACLFFHSILHQFTVCFLSLSFLGAQYDDDRPRRSHTRVVNPPGGKSGIFLGWGNWKQSNIKQLYKPMTNVVFFFFFFFFFFFLFCQFEFPFFNFLNIDNKYILKKDSCPVIVIFRSANLIYPSCNLLLLIVLKFKKKNKKAYSNLGLMILQSF